MAAAKTHGRTPAQLGEFAGGWLDTGLRRTDCDLPAFEALKGDAPARLETQIITHPLRHRHLRFARKIGRHY